MGLGASGLIVGGVSGLLRSSPPVLFAAASGIQWFALGSTFWGMFMSILCSPALPCLNPKPATRGIMLHVWGMSEAAPKERTYASGIAGAFSGGTVGLLTSSCFHFFPKVLKGTLLTNPCSSQEGGLMLCPELSCSQSSVL